MGCGLVDDLARVHDTERVQGLLDAPHHLCTHRVHGSKCNVARIRIMKIVILDSGARSKKMRVRGKK